jgi:hypothetical protein
MRIAGHGNKYESNQETQSQSFGIGDPSVVIEILRNRLYEHKIRTLVQEYMSNARDAHREIKQTRKIEVVAPTQLEPTFKVRDFGPGISPERMATVFVLYGASTKRTNNTQTGGFGIGAKSAWSYADGFVIVSTVDGTRRTYHAHVGASNVGQLDLLETTETKDPNGCEIQVAVNPRDVNEFTQSIQRACYFWNDEETPILKNVTLPPKIVTYDLGSLSIIGTNESRPTFINTGYGSDILVIDGIMYDLNRNLLDKVQPLKDVRNELTGSMIIKVPNGLIQVSASREKIDDSDFTRKGLAKIGTRLYADVKKHVADKIASINSVKGFVEVYHSMYKFFVMQNNEYKGFRFDGQYLYTSMLGSVTFRRYALDYNQKVKDSSVKGIPVDQLTNIYLMKQNENAVTMNRRIRAELINKKDMYIIRERPTSATASDGTVTQLKFDVPPAKAIKELQSILGTFHDFHAIKFVVPPRTPKALKAQKLASQQSFHVLNGYGRDIKNTTVNDLQAQGKNFVYMLVSDWQSEKKDRFNDMIREFGGSLSESGKKPVFIAVSNSTYEIIKDEKGFTPYADWLDTVQLTENIRLRMMHSKCLNSEIIEKVSQLDGVKIKKLTNLVDHYKLMKKAVANSRDSVPDVVIKKFKDDAEYLKFLEVDAELKELVNDKYPLLKHMNRYANAEEKREIIWYLNNK